MSVKKKLGLGVASAALGLSLVGGGTWAAFNDTATINNHFAAGTLNLQVGKSHNKPINFDLSNLKPGDNIQRIFTLDNVGTLAIKEVLMSGRAANFNGNGDSSRDDFLAQFEVDFMKVDSETTQWQPRQDVVTGDFTLADLVNGDVTDIAPAHVKDGKINLASIAGGTDGRIGIPVDPDDKDDVFIQITFKNNLTKKANGEYVQNKFMNDSVNVYFDLEATQWDGVHVDTNHGNGEVNNGVQNSADGSTMPNPRTKGTPVHSTDVED
ncbi:TasA family protein [Mesobacillus subterraneus]|uniref:TasA family protein n=1 Tax=Mesobacillus subterraneus TaxID=285983 RepID=UPI001CFF40CA|nr:TasA family protein [Mesobacillus subterraneus]WLR54368.1 TasA family protein [Mesobacillus subterraneus]